MKSNMNTDSKSIVLLTLAAVTILNFQSCKKYDEGPSFSLISKKGRLTGEWEVVKIDGQSYNSYNGADPGTNYEMFWEFESDGDFKMTMSYSYPGYSYSDSYKGEWEWENDKEEIEIKIDNSNYSIDFEILKLTNKELILEDNYGQEWEFEKD